MGRHPEKCSAQKGISELTARGWGYRKLGYFKEFSDNAIIRDFDGLDFPAPKPETSYNDDVVLPLYEGALRSYRGTQRKGIRGEHPNSCSASDHVQEAPQAPFFLSQLTPLPESVVKSIEFSATAPKKEITSFWRSQIHMLESLANKHGALADKWLEARPPPLKGLKPVNVLLLAALMRDYGIKGQKWANQCIFGFPITGVLSQKFAYPVDKRAKTNILSHKELLQSAQSRFLGKGSGSESTQTRRPMEGGTRSVQKRLARPTSTSAQ